MDATAKELNKKPEIIRQSSLFVFKKRKSEEFFDVCDEWHQEDIKLLTGSEKMQYKNLNK